MRALWWDNASHISTCHSRDSQPHLPIFHPQHHKSYHILEWLSSPPFVFSCFVILPLSLVNSNSSLLPLPNKVPIKSLLILYLIWCELLSLLQEPAISSIWKIWHSGGKLDEKYTEANWAYQTHDLKSEPVATSLHTILLTTSQPPCNLLKSKILHAP